MWVTLREGWSCGDSWFREVRTAGKSSNETDRLSNSAMSGSAQVTSDDHQQTSPGLHARRESNEKIKQRLAMKHVVPHDLDEEKAQKVAQSAFDSYKKRFSDYNPTVTWSSPKRADIAFKVKGITLKGGVDIKPSSYELDLEVPFLLKPFKGKAISVIEEEINKWIGKAKA